MCTVASTPPTRTVTSPFAAYTFVIFVRSRAVDAEERGGLRGVEVILPLRADVEPQSARELEGASQLAVEEMQSLPFPLVAQLRDTRYLRNVRRSVRTSRLPGPVLSVSVATLRIGHVHGGIALRLGWSVHGVIILIWIHGGQLPCALN